MPRAWNDCVVVVEVIGKGEQKHYIPRVSSTWMCLGLGAWTTTFRSVFVRPLDQLRADDGVCAIFCHQVYSPRSAFGPFPGFNPSLEKCRYKLSISSEHYGISNYCIKMNMSTPCTVGTEFAVFKWLCSAETDWVCCRLLTLEQSFDLYQSSLPILHDYRIHVNSNFPVQSSVENMKLQCVSSHTWCILRVPLDGHLTLSPLHTLQFLIPPISKLSHAPTLIMQEWNRILQF